MAPVVLVHGLFGSLSDPGIIAGFGEQAGDVHAPDLLGYGNCRAHAGAWTLDDQADHVAAALRRQGIGTPAHIVGHSVGGAVSLRLARRHPALVRSVTTVEGNFTLRDAFWSQRIAGLPLEDIAAEVAMFRADVAGWIGKSSVAPTPWTLAVASAWLDNQPVGTLRAQARAVVACTGSPAFLDDVRTLLDGGLRLHLLAGTRSRARWSVPEWVVARAASATEVPGGHLMMLEDPARFAQAVLGPLDG